MYSENKRNFDVFSLVIGILLIFLGGYSLYRPDTTLAFISIMIGMIAIIKGIDYKTVSYHKIRALNKLNIKGTVELFIALCEWDKHYFKLQSCIRES